jgi:hypothetical protein
MIHSFLRNIDETVRWPEDLQLIVFCRSKHDPWIVLVPVEVANAICESTVHEQPNSLSV